MFRILAIDYVCGKIIGKRFCDAIFDTLEEAKENAKFYDDCINGPTGNKNSLYFVKHIPIETITRNCYFSRKWDELSNAWNNTVKPKEITLLRLSTHG